MANATKFYLPVFKTGISNGKLYTYLSGTDTPATTYSDVIGTPHTNPIQLDENGEAIIYINDEVNYRYVIKDAEDNTVSDNNNISQLKGEPGPSSTIKGDPGRKGMKGDQGQSGDQGPVGFDGPDGDKGLPYISKFEFPSSGSLVVPKGVDHIYVTASAGGGAGASWSNCFFIMRYKDTSRTELSQNPPARREGETSNVTSTISLKFAYPKFQSFIFFPGTGFAGQSIYRHKLKLNPDIDNTITMSIGAGGTPIENSYNGGSGGNTTISVNGEIALKLLGGSGGENKFPVSRATAPAFPTDGTPIMMNIGFETGMAIFQHTSTTSVAMSVPTANQAVLSYNTFYKQNHPTTIYIEKGIKLSVYIPQVTISKNNLVGNGYHTNEYKGALGEGNIFGNHFNTYASKQDSSTSLTVLKTATKGGSNTKGWGAGGAISFLNQISAATGQTFRLMIPQQSVTSTTLVDLNERDIKNAIITYMTSFRLNDSFEPGVIDIPDIDDTSGVWNIYDTVKSTYQANTSYMMYNGAGFYDNVNTVLATTSADCRGGNGVQGFAIIEYGSIVEH